MISLMDIAEVRSMLIFMTIDITFIVGRDVEPTSVNFYLTLCFTNEHTRTA